MSTPREAPRASGSTLGTYALLTIAGTWLHALAFFASVPFVGAATVASALLVHVTYSTVFALAGLAPAFVVGGALRLARCAGRPAARAVVLALAVLGPATVHFALLTDAIVHRRYGYHLNGMIWNLVTTEGGIESMGADRGTQVAIAGIAVLFVALQAALLAAAARVDRLRDVAARLLVRRRVVIACVLLVLAHGAERVAYGLSYAASYKPVLVAGPAYPWYQRTRMTTFARQLGISRGRDDEGIDVDVDSAVLDYPKAPLRRREGARDLNVVWLVSESLRWDMLDPEIMPATTAFARDHALRFDRHYSAGNGTRMGMFGMFYGLYGMYWFPFLSATRGPVVLDALLDAGYDAEAFTSARFTFPEFDKTLFARLPRERLHEGNPDLKGWENDQRNVAALLESIDRRDPAQPFFRFLFFESPHARYFFPKEAVIRPDYARSVNYVTMDLEDAAEIQAIKDRYVNACHHLDMQLARIYEHLERTGLLDSTIVIVTGDHGEEFMENGRWGHHSAFSDQQTRTPLVLHAPGVAPARVATFSSHLDLPATVLGLLGYENDPRDYSLGQSLIDAPPRTSLVIADWDRLALVDDGAKIVLPVRGGGFSDDVVTGIDDREVADPDAVYGARRDAVVRILEELSLFTK